MHLFLHIVAILLSIHPVTSESWHAFESYEQATASYFPTGDSAIIHLNIILDNTDAKLIFTPVEMITKSARIEFATIFYDKHLTNATLKHSPSDPKLAAPTCNRECVISLIAKRIKHELNKRTNVLGIGAISIKKIWAHGQNLVYHRGSVNISPSLERFGEWEEEAIELLTGYLSTLATGTSTSKKKILVFDVGANMGLFTLALHSTFPSFEYHTFEPQRILHNIICSNVMLQGVEQNIITHNVGVGDKKEILQVPIVTNPGNAARGDRYVEMLNNEKFNSLCPLY